MAGLGHDRPLAHARLGGRRGEAAAQRVPGVVRGVEAGGGGGALDAQGDRAVGETRRPDVAGTPIPVAAEPTALSMSADGRYLYVGSDGRGQIQRLDLAAGRVDRTIDLGPDPAGQPYAVRGLVVVADAPETLAVLCVRAHSTQAFEMAIVRDGVTLPRARDLGLDTSGLRLIACRGIADHVFVFALYGFPRVGRLRWLDLTIAADGIGLTRGSDAFFYGGYDTIPHTPACLDGQVYGMRGDILGAGDDRYSGRIDPAVAGQIVVDAPTHRLFYVRDGVATASGDATTITIVDAPTRTPFATVRVAGATVGTGPSALVRWGADGLAWLDATQHLVIIQAPWVGGRP